MSQNPGQFTLPDQPQNALAKEILAASWRRCISDYQLNSVSRHETAVASMGTVREIQQSLEELVYESSSVITRIRQVAQDVGYVLLLSNPEGVVFESFADSVRAAEIEAEGLMRGSVWYENMVGTNGIGTAIVSRQAVTVYGNAHFKSSFRGYTCSAAPIFAPDGRVLAIVDLSGRAGDDHSDEYRFAEYFVREAAAQASMNLFQKQHKGDCLVALSSEPDPMPMRSRAIVATDEDGTIIGATPEAFALLGVPELRDLGGASLQDIWDVSFHDLQPLSARNIPLKLKDGSSGFVTAFMPEARRQRHVQRAAERAAAAGALQAVGRAAGDGRPLDRVDTGDAKIKEIVNLCRKVIDRNLPILILGETGVGKDTLARAMHDESARSARPYVAVNCAAIPATLLASELFGYAPGSFTGASRTGRVGKIQASSSGTLFLDEIGDMPLELQAHLLRVLEERMVTPLGSTESIPVDLRIICATHRKLSTLVEQGRFRSDLYFRIRGIQFTLPSLRERSDIVSVAERIMQDEAVAAGRAVATFSPEFVDMLRRYTWPGNIRELRSLIRLLLSIHQDTVLTLEHLPDDMFQWGETASKSEGSDGGSANMPKAVVPESRVSPLSSAPPTLAAANEAAEAYLIVETLRTFKWSVTDAARKLGISRGTLHRKIKKYGIVSPNNLTD
jgi:sigma-54 dependent transcriptional regulator, acetoin dehydrogenase operon transcriptional activator AcoR